MASNLDAAVLWLDIHEATSKGASVISGHVDDKVRFRPRGKRKPLQPSPSRRCRFHLQVVIQRKGKVSRGRD